MIDKNLNEQKVTVNIDVDFDGSETNEEEFVNDIETSIQNVIDASGVNADWTIT